MLVGEGPGATEDQRGLPFVGRAGKLLDDCLIEAGMKREHVFITNVVKCRPTVETDGRLSNRAPDAIEASTCVSLWLEKQLAIMRPLVIVSLGSPSANAIIRKGFKMTMERGKWFESKYAPYAIAAFHPAYILRKQGPGFQDARQTLVDDLRAAKEKAIIAKNEARL
jgi:DNA polymerase